MSVGQLIYALCSGGGCLSDSEALNDDLLAREPIGVDKFADRTQVGESLREPSEESVAGLRQLRYEFVAWVWKEAEPRRLLPDDQREVFFDDTQLEVRGKTFEGAALNYNGELALSWQTLWVGPLLSDCHVGSPQDVSDQPLPLEGARRPTFMPTAGAAVAFARVPSRPKAGSTRLAATSGRARLPPVGGRHGLAAR